MTLLVRTPHPYPTESLLGYVLRVSEVNGYETPWHILRLASIEQGRSATAGFPALRFAEILGIDGRELEGLAYKARGDDGEYLILGHPMGRSERELHMQVRQPRFCPKCVVERGFIDAFWHLKLAIACPVHRTKALESCPACGNRLRWYRPGLLTCSCGASLAGAQTTVVADELAALLGMLLAKLHGKSLLTMENPFSLPLAQLEPLSLQSMLALLESIARGWLRSRKVGEDETAVWTTVARSLAHWPIGYHDFLSRIGQTLQDQCAGVGLVKQFEPFYLAVFKRRTGVEERGFLRDEFFRFGTQVWGKALPDEKLVRNIVRDTRRFVSKSAYARTHGLSKPALDRLISNGVITTNRAGNGAKERFVVDATSSVTPEQAVGLVTERNAARQLGLPVSVLRHLRASGVYVPMPRVGYVRSWYQQDVDAFLARGMKLVNNAFMPTVHGTSLSDAMQLKLRDAKAKAGIVAAVFSGELPVIAARNGTLGGLLIDTPSLESFVKCQRALAQGNTLSLADVAEETRIDPMAISAAVELGLLDAIAVPGGHRLTVESVAAFRDQYSSLAKLATESGTSSAKLQRTCVGLGIGCIELACGSSGRVQRIVRRTDADKLCAQRSNEVEHAQRQLEARMDRLPSYERALTNYLNSLVLAGKSIPLRGGKPNRALIARCCGFGRDVFYDQPSVQRLLDTFVAHADEDVQVLCEEPSLDSSMKTR